MTLLEQPELKQTFSKWKPEAIAEIIDKLSGGKSNLRVDVQNITLTLGNRQIELAGEVDFRVVHESRHSSFNSGLNIPENVRRNDDTPAYQSGKIFISTGDLQVLRINVAGKRLDVNVEDKQFIKRLIQLRNEFAPNNQSPEAEVTKKKKKESSSPLAMIRTIADTCKKLGITVTVSYNGHRIATMGADASPKLLQHVTKTNALAINSVYAAIVMMI